MSITETIALMNQAEAYSDQYFDSLADMFQVLELIYDDEPKPIDYWYLRVNPAFEKLVGKSADQLLGKRAKDLFGIVENHWLEVYDRVAKTGISTVYEDYGEELDKYYEVYVWKVGEKQVGVTFRDTTNKNKTRMSLEDSERELQNLIDNLREGVALCEIVFDENKTPFDYRFLKTNVAFESQTGLANSEMLGSTIKEVFPDIEPSWITRFAEVAISGKSISFTEFNHNTNRYYDVAAFSPKKNQFVMLFSDATRLAKSQKELGKFQRLDSIGKLAGGVAHDFNNMLTVILGYSAMALSEIEPESQVAKYLNEIKKAAEWSARTTQQLLAFASKQYVTPVALNLNDAINDTYNMWRKLAGEDIEFSTMFEPHLWSVKIDPTQIDQMLANLYTNARAAIFGVGKVVIETANEVVDSHASDVDEQAIAGEFVRMTVTDSGHGMDSATLDRIFEPFFTTKDAGEGTGLGLASVYGSVRQNGGFAIVRSEPGYGTSFSIYLPRHIGASPDTNDGNLAPAVVQSGTETILLVEDEPFVLKMTSNLLRRLGYTVVTASNPDMAIEIAQESNSEIHLLMTDVVMPGMNGLDLADQLLQRSPRIKCLYMSGYTFDYFASHGATINTEQFIEKPFSLEDLADKVHNALNYSGT